MKTTTRKITTSAPALTYDEILDQGSLTEDEVLLCLNGKLVRRYEAVAARIAERAAAHAAALEQARISAKARANIAAVKAADGGDPDDRLTTRTPAEPDPDPDPAYVDPEQGDADRLRAEMKRFTVAFIIRAVPDEDWSALLEDHAPRKDPTDAKKIDPRDWEGVNSSTFYRALVRASIASPEHDDVKFDRLMRLLTSAQFSRLAAVATDVNKRDADLPFSRDDWESPPR